MRDREQARLRYVKNRTKRASGLVDKADIQERTGDAEWHSLADKFERKEKFPSIDEVAKAAAKAGMTYGKYVEKYGGKWQ